MINNEDNSRYDGEFKNEMMDGAGLVYYEDGKVFVGEFREDQKHGEGYLFHEDKQTRFVEVWNRGTRVSVTKSLVSAKEIELQLAQPWLINRNMKEKK